MTGRDGRTASRPLTAKAFTLAQYATDTFRPFTIGPSRASTDSLEDDVHRESDNVNPLGLSHSGTRFSEIQTQPSRLQQQSDAASAAPIADQRGRPSRQGQSQSSRPTATSHTLQQKQQIQNKKSVNQPQTRTSRSGANAEAPSSSRLVTFRQPLSLPHRPMTAPTLTALTKRDALGPAVGPNANRAHRKRQNAPKTDRITPTSAKTPQQNATAINNMGAKVHQTKDRHPNRPHRHTKADDHKHDHDNDREAKDATHAAPADAKTALNSSDNALGTGGTSISATAASLSNNAVPKASSLSAVDLSSGQQTVNNPATNSNEFDNLRDNDSSTISSVVARLGRPRVPHDFHVGKYNHVHACSEAPSGMVFKTLAFTARSRSTTFGVSNRIPFLRALYAANGSASIRPQYPAAFHGPGGEGRQFALGLSLAGSAGDDRVLDTACTYGSARMAAKQQKPPTLTSSGKSPERITENAARNNIPIPSDPHAHHHIREVLGIHGGSWTNTKKPFSSYEQTHSFKPTINTRYSSNTEWKHATRTTVQAPNESHFYISESDRFQHLPFSDNELAQRRKGYQVKIQKFVRDKNADSVSALLETSL